MIAVARPAADVWARFVGACQADEDLGPYVGVVMGLAGAFLGDPAKNVELLERIAGHLAHAKDSP